MKYMIFDIKPRPHYQPRLNENLGYRNVLVNYTTEDAEKPHINDQSVEQYNRTKPGSRGNYPAVRSSTTVFAREAAYVIIMASDMEPERPRTRAKKACLACNARRVRCNVLDMQPCRNCVSWNLACELGVSRRGK